jgi:hypothetical protein
MRRAADDESMASVAAAIGFLLAAVGALGVASPSLLLSTVARFQSPRGLYVIAVIRIGIGAAFLLAAAGSRAPAFLGTLGGLALFAGAATPFFGVRRFEALTGWWSRQSGVFVRGWCTLVVGLGLAVVWTAAA